MAEPIARVADEGGPGYHLIDPGVVYLYPELDHDTQTRILSRLIRQLDRFPGLPERLVFEVIPAQYLGPPYPAIGLLASSAQRGSARGYDLALRLEEWLGRYVKYVGIERLREEAAGETITWREVLAHLQRGDPRSG